MLLRFEITNFLSFHKKTSFDMFPNNKRTTFAEHINTEGEVPLLRTAAIYGANGAGKSNFIKAFDFLRNLVLDNNFLKGIDLNDYIFQLTPSPSEEIAFTVEFYTEGAYYLYELSIHTEGLWEKLSLSGIGKKENTPIFERQGVKLLFPTLQHEIVVNQLLERNPFASLLSLNTQFPVLDKEEVQQAYTWFAERTTVITIDSFSPQLIRLLSSNPELLAFTNRIFSAIGLGIQKVEIAATPMTQWVKEQKAEMLEEILNDIDPEGDGELVHNKSTNLLHVSTQNGITTIEELLFDQLGVGGYKKKMRITAQSEGTRMLLRLIPALYSAIYLGRSIFIDEVDNSIHPELIFRLIDFYSQQRGNGQLIFTTHSTHLLNQQELLRPDEIWVTEKHEGNTTMYSLNEYKIHNTIDIERGYLDGRYGGIPHISLMSDEAIKEEAIKD